MFARRGDVVEAYHGTLVPDPYRWLEDPADPETLAWVTDQNATTAAFVAATGRRDAIAERLKAIWDYPKFGTPTRRGEQLFYQFNSGLLNQAILYQVLADDAAAEPRILLDPNTLTSDGTAALTGMAFTRDGSLLCYGVAEHGSDWQVYRVRRTSDGQDLPDAIRFCKFTSIAWMPDRSGFFYERYLDPATIPADQQSLNCRVYFHTLGTDQTADLLVYARPDAPGLGFGAQITDDGAFVILRVWDGTDPRNRVYYRPLASEGEFVRLLDDFDATYEFLGNDGTTCYFLTTLDAPKKRVIAIDLAHPDRAAWQTIIPEGPDVIQFGLIIQDQLILGTLHDVHDVLRRFDLRGEQLGVIALPGLGAIVGLSGHRDDDELYLLYTSFLTPPVVYRYHLTTDQLAPWPATAAAIPTGGFDPREYETEQVFYHSKDGTRVPLFLTHRRGLMRDGQTPTLLYGYGGFNISLTPTFSPSVAYWLEQGGIYAVANLRGGDEYGEEWHRAGTLERKQNVFDDFIAAAEWLIAQGFTRSDRLAIEGGSNGGLLVAACETQRPDLFGAVVCRVPVIDMLRYHKFTVGRYWVSDYGNAEEDAEQFRFLYAYSPLHNVHPGTAYPPTLILSADTDDRVVPAHAKKFAAALQWAQAGPNPILLRVEMKAGHGLGKPTSKLIEEQADKFAFLEQVLGR